MLALLVLLCILALVAWGARAVLAGLGAPPFVYTIVVVVACIIALVLVAQAFGVAVPRVT